MLNLNSLHETFPKVSSAWEHMKFKNNIKLRRELKTEHNECSAFQETSVYKNVDAKFHDINISTPFEFVEENIPNSNTSFAKEIRYQNECFKDFKFKDEIVKCVTLIEQ